MDDLLLDNGLHVSVLLFVILSAHHLIVKLIAARKENEIKDVHKLWGWFTTPPSVIVSMRSRG